MIGWGMIKDCVVKLATVALETSHAVAEKLRNPPPKISKSREEYRRRREQRRRARNIKLRKLKEKREARFRESLIGMEVTGDEVSSLSSSWNGEREIKWDDDMNLFY